MITVRNAHVHVPVIVTEEMHREHDMGDGTRRDDVELACLVAFSRIQSPVMPCAVTSSGKVFTVVFPLDAFEIDGDAVVCSCGGVFVDERCTGCRRPLV